MNKTGTAQQQRAERFPATAESDAATLPTRWLAELCGLPSPHCSPHLASILVAQEEHATEAAAHIGWWSRHPNAGSEFARLAGPIPDISDSQVFAALNQRGYDGLLYKMDGKVIGHCFFQRHDTELHAFSVWISEQHRGGAFMAMAFFDFVAYASMCPGIMRARVGAGRPGDRILRPLKRFSENLGWLVRKGAWVDFCTPDSECSGLAPGLPGIYGSAQLAGHRLRKR
jgi:hypothetical protein